MAFVRRSLFPLACHRVCSTPLASPSDREGLCRQPHSLLLPVILGFYLRAIVLIGIFPLIYTGSHGAKANSHVAGLMLCFKRPASKEGGLPRRGLFPIGLLLGTGEACSSGDCAYLLLVVPRAWAETTYLASRSGGIVVLVCADHVAGAVCVQKDCGNPVLGFAVAQW